MLLSQCSRVWWTHSICGFLNYYSHDNLCKIFNRYLLNPNFKQYRQKTWVIFSISICYITFINKSAIGFFVIKCNEKNQL